MQTNTACHCSYMWFTVKKKNFTFRKLYSCGLGALTLVAGVDQQTRSSGAVNWFSHAIGVDLLL